MGHITVSYMKGVPCSSQPTENYHMQFLSPPQSMLGFFSSLYWFYNQQLNYFHHSLYLLLQSDEFRVRFPTIENY